jgi:hypothetical protein
VFGTRNKIKGIGSWIVLLILLSCIAPGQTKTGGTPAPLPAQSHIRIEAYPKAATIGDPIRLQLDIEMPAGSQAEIPKPVAKSGDFSIVDFSSGLVPASADKAKGSTKSVPHQSSAPAHHQTQITIAVYRTGKFTFPAIPIRIKTPEGKEIAAESLPVDIEIRSVLTEKNQDLKDLKRQAEIPEPVNWLLWIMVIAAACAICALIWYFRRRRRMRPIALTPAETRNLLDIAESDLRNLLARGLPGSSEEKAFYIAISDITKRILEVGYGIHTAEQTTSEIMESFRNRSDTGLENRDLIESFLTRCDMVKFARYVPTNTEHEAASQNALRILEEARKAVISRQSLVVSEQKADNG